MGVYQNWAKRFHDAGYSPIPINPKTKGPLVDDWQQFSEKPMSEDQLKSYVQACPSAMIGLVMGSEVKTGWKIVSIDIDDDDLVESVKFAVGDVVSAKVGAKGLTIFCRIPSNMNSGTKRLKRMDNGKPSKKPSVEILGAKSQTVIPPSIHPTTGKPYKWIGKSLVDIDVELLPILNAGVMKELEGICAGTYGKVLALNTMTWLGEGKGGDTHDTCTEAVGFMVRDGWTDTDIYARIKRAKKQACERNGDEYNWPEESYKINEWIKSARDKGFDKQGEEARAKKRKSSIEVIMAEWGLEHLGGEDLAVTTRLHGLLRYNEGHWPVLDEKELERTLASTFNEAKASDVRAAISKLKMMTYRAGFGTTSSVEIKHDTKMWRLCLQNGTINLGTGELERHKPEDELFHQLPIMWEDNSECPNYDKFMQETFRGDKITIDCVQEFMAYSLVPDNSMQKMMVFFGSGANGKGTLVRLWTSLFDPSVVGTVNVSQLNDERMLTSLMGKMLNVSSEQSRFDQLADGRLKQITGSDPVTTRKLYAEPDNNQRMITRFVMQVNQMPSTTDTSHALARRLIMIPFLNEIRGNNADLLLDKKLISERSAVLRKHLIPALRNLYARGYFEEPESSKLAVAEYMATNNSVKYWLEEQCSYPKTEEELSSWKHWTPSRELYVHYSEFCKVIGQRNPYNEIQWGGILKVQKCESVSRHLKSMKRNVKMRPIKILDRNDEF